MNPDVDSTSWLREFAECRSETAFAQLVHRHIHLVYSVALRRCGGRNDWAQDVCQTVFIDLARKAPVLPPGIVVSGWLYQHTCFVTTTLLRSESRRQEREKTAMEFQTSAAEPDWSRVAPLLDDVLLELAVPDRDSLVLRYLEQCPLAVVGLRLGLSENAARMRVNRALEKLRTRLSKRGVTSTASALASVLTGPAVSAAPASLVSVMTATALAATVSSVSSLGLLTFMTTTKLKIATAIALLLGVGVPLILQRRDTHRLQEENAHLRRLLVQAEMDTQAAQNVSRQTEDEVIRLKEAQSELLRLRAELARQRRNPVVTNGPAAEEPPPAASRDTAARWSTGGSLGLHETFVTAAWPWKDRAAVLLVRPVTPSAPGQPPFQMESTIVSASLETLQRHGLAGGESEAPQVLSEDVTTNLLAALEQDGARLTKTEPTAPGQEGSVYVGFTEDDYDQTIRFKLAPELEGDRQLHLAVDVERRTLSVLEQQMLVEPDAGVRRELGKQIDAARREEEGNRPGSR